MYVIKIHLQTPFVFIQMITFVKELKKVPLSYAQILESYKKKLKTLMRIIKNHLEK